MRKVILEYKKPEVITTQGQVDPVATLRPIVKMRKVRITVPPGMDKFSYAPKLAQLRNAHRAKVNRPGTVSESPIAKKENLASPRIFIATNTSVPAGLRRSWKHIECISVAAYLQVLTRAVAELKWQVNTAREDVTTDMELLLAFGSAVADRNERKKYFVSGCGLLMSEFKDMDTAFRNSDEEEDW
jgi:hypothetical protein